MMDTISFTFRLTKDLMERLKRLAQRERRSLSNMIVWILEEWLKQKEVRDGD